MSNILILGYSGHGKDELRRIFAELSGRYIPATSHITAQEIMVPWFDRNFPSYYVGIDTERAQDRALLCYDDRNNWRAAWHEVIKQYNTPDKAKLAKFVLLHTNVYVGMRCKEELKASIDLFDLVIWVDASKRKPVESKSSNSIHYNSKTMLKVNNNGTVKDLEAVIRSSSEILFHLLSDS